MMIEEKISDRVKYIKDTVRITLSLWFERIWRFGKKNRDMCEYTICLAYIVILWITFGNIVCKQIPQTILNSLNISYDLIEGSFWISLGLFAVIIYITIKLFCKWWLDKDFIKKGFLIIAFIVALWKNPFVFAKLFWKFDVREWISLCLIIPTTIKLWPLAVQYFQSFKSNSQKNNANVESIRFTTKEELFKLHSVTKGFIEQIAGFINGTDVKNSSFSIGVSGGWGTGKTSFLRGLKEIIGDKAYFVDFNPWQCTAPEQVINDFFDTLREELCKSHSSLDRPIRRYIKSFSKYEWPGYVKLMLELFARFSKNGLAVEKNELSNQLTKLEKPVIVMIDDVDRLEQNEIFEVLRLIRNVGDLKNIIYVCAYDKDYVVQMLESKNIKKADAFLEKIFDVEIHLPKSESYQLINLLASELKTMSPNLSIDVSNFSQDIKKLIVNILGSFRGVKQFARSFVVNYCYIQKKLFEDIDLSDFLWLELLNRYDKKTYDNLYYNAHAYLTEDTNGFYVIKEEFKCEKFNHEDYTKMLLSLMFRKKQTDNGIRNIDDFPKYFSLGIDPRILSHEEFKSALRNEKDETLQNVVMQWIESKDVVRILETHFTGYEIKNHTEDEVKRFVLLLLFFSERIIVKYRSEIYMRLNVLLAKDRYSSISGMSELVQDWFENRIQSDGNCRDIALLLKLMYCKDKYAAIPKEIESVIDNKTIEKLFDENAMHYLVSANPDAKDIFNLESELGCLMPNSCVAIIHDSYQDKYVWKNFALNAIIRYYKGKANLQNKEFLELYQKMFPEPFAKSGSPEDTQRYNHEMENVNLHYEQYFGSDKEDLSKLREALVVKAE